MAESKDKKDKMQKEADATTSSTHGNIVMLNDDISIFVKEPLTQFDKGETKAYRASGGSQHGTRLFALICDKTATPRFNSITKYASINSNHLCKLVTHGKIYWPVLKQEVYCFVYEDSIGLPILSHKKHHLAFGWKSETVMSNIVIPIIDTLTRFRNKEIAHSEVWLGNMFDGGADAGQKIFLGECLATPAGSQMPILYEPVERSIADAKGRGPGDSIDDLYSLGVCLAIMLRHEDPMEGFSDRKVIEQKLEKGSYLALLGKERLSGAILELLRGLLFDDPEQRWTVEDLEAWADGRRLSPKQAPKRAKSMRPLIFRGTKYIRPEFLAIDLHKDPHETMKIIENGELEQWIERAIEEKLIKNRLEQAMYYIPALERGNNYNDRVTAVIAHALYPEAAVCYRDIAFHPTGFGKYLLSNFINEKDIQPFIDILKYSFIIPIVREARILDKGSLMASFDLCRSYIKQKALNAGIERCFYIMDPEAPCLSPILKQYYSLTLTDILFAFEDLCSKNKKPDILFDRHIISFISVKDKHNIDPYINDMSSRHRHERVLAQLKTLATMQKRCGLKGLPNLAKWIANELPPVYDRLHDKKRREDIEEKVQAYAKDGDIQLIAAVMNNTSLYGEDLNQFKNAMAQYDALVQEQNLIKKNLKRGRQYGLNSGRQLASALSMLIAIIIMVVSVYSVLSGG